MTDPRYRHYILIIDRSGSMSVICDQTQQGIRRYTDEMRALVFPGERATLSLYQFDTVHDTVCSLVPLQDAEPYTLVPRNATALLDACGFAITAEGEALAALPEDRRPGKVIVTIATDGQENSSHEWTRDRVRDLISRQQDTYGWQFAYIGANQDAWAVAEGIGIPAASAMSYRGDAAGTSAAWAGMTASASRYSAGLAGSLAYTPEEQDAAGGSPEER